MLAAVDTASGTQTFLLAVRIDADQLAGGQLISDARVPAIGDLNGSDNRFELTTTIADNGSAPPTPEPDPIAIQERAVSFLNGFNYVVWTGPTMPVDEALLTFPNLGRLVVIFEFNAGAQLWDSFRQNFPANSISQLVSGRAYVFSMSGSAIWQMPLVVDLSGTQAVAVGFTLIGWVGADGQPDDVLDALAQDRNVPAFHRFNAQTQQYEAFRPGIPVSVQGIRAISQYEVFFLFATAETSITQ